MNLHRKYGVATLCYPIDFDKVLLAKKTRKIGVGKWNGWGGGVEKGENERECTVRELQKESGLIAQPNDLRYRGMIVFHNVREDDSTFAVEVDLFTLHTWSGAVKVNEEMKDPRWFHTDALPWKDMMPSDKFWLPYVLLGYTVTGEVWHTRNQEALARPPDLKVSKTA